MYRNDRQLQAHGGVAIAVRNNIQHKLCAETNTNFIENISIELPINNKQTRITAAYSPRSSPHFTNNIKLLTSSNKQYLLFGDFNAKHSSWNCRSNNASGNSFSTLKQSNDFMIYHTDSHTHFPHSGQTPPTLDLLVSNVNSAFDLVTHQNQMNSDHSPLICICGQTERAEHKLFDYCKANWRKYSSIIEQQINTIASLEVPISKTQSTNSRKSYLPHLDLIAFH